MSFMASSEAFRNVFMEPEPEVGMVDEFLAAVVRYLQSRHGIDEAEQLEEWIVKGGGMMGFLCSPEFVDSMSESMINESVPFVAVTEKLGNTGFLIRFTDDEKVREIRDKVLKEKAHYCEIVNGEKISEAILKSGDKDKSILCLSGLDKEQAEMFLHLCGQVMDGDPVGVDERTDGTYTFSFIGKKAIRRGIEESVSIDFLYSILMMESLGFKAEDNRRIASNRIAFDRAWLNKFAPSKGKKEVWIVGKGPHYIRVGQNGFEYGAVAEENNSPVLSELYSADINVPDYDAQLNSYISMIESPTCTEDQEKAIQHLSGKGDGSLKFNRTGDDKLIHDFELELLKMAGSIIQLRSKNDSAEVVPGRWDGKFTNYLQHMATLIDGTRMALRDIANGVAPDNYEKYVSSGYRHEDVQRLVDLCNSYGISLEAYSPAISAMRDPDIKMIEAHPRHIENIEELFAHRDDDGRRDGDRDYQDHNQRRRGGPRRE